MDNIYKWISLAKKDDQDAFNEITKYFYPIIKNIASSYFIYGGDENDIIQEGFIGLYNAVRSYDDQKNDSFEKYAKICIHRSIITAIKSASRKKHSPLNDYIEIDKQDVISNDNPEKLVLNREKILLIYEKIDVELSDFEKSVLELFIDGYSYKEIAIKLKKPVKSVDNAIARIRSKLNWYMPFNYGF